MVILRDRDNSSCGPPQEPTCNPWRAESDGNLEERRYCCQNWRADVVAITKSDGSPLERVRYSSYGEPKVYPNEPPCVRGFKCIAIRVAAAA
jgi:hypothetical protein